MDEQQQELFTVAEAAASWGISTQAVYQRLPTLQRKGFVVAKGKTRYITRECMEKHQQEKQPLAKEVDKALPTLQPTLQEDIGKLTRELLEERGRASTLQATIDAQQAHINSLQAALDKAQTALDQEQTLHMATMQQQQRLPAGRGGGFMEWLRGGKKEGQHGR